VEIGLSGACQALRQNIPSFAHLLLKICQKSIINFIYFSDISQFLGSCLSVGEESSLSLSYS